MISQIKYQLSNNDRIMKTISAEYVDWCSGQNQSIIDHACWESFVRDRLDRDWEIIRLKSSWNCGCVSMRENMLYLDDTIASAEGNFTLHAVMKQFDVIDAVRRLSDEFTLNDVVSFKNDNFTINKFILKGPDLYVVLSDGTNCAFTTKLSDVKKVRPVQTYRTTGDGVEIMPDEKYYGVSVQASGVADQIKEYVFTPYRKIAGSNRTTFKHRETAIDHLIHNVPVLSKRDCLELMEGYTSIMEQKLHDAVVSKIQF